MNNARRNFLKSLAATPLLAAANVYGIEQNLREMKQQVKSTTDSVTKGKSSLLVWGLVIAGAVVLGIGLWLLLK